MQYSKKEIELFNEIGIKIEPRDYSKEEKERLKIEVTDYILSQSTKDINKYTNKFSKILY